MSNLTMQGGNPLLAALMQYNAPAAGASLGAGVGGSPGMGAGTSAGGYDPTIWDKLLGWKDEESGISHNGWGMPALKTAGGIANTFLGLKQYGLAKDQLEQQKREFNLNFGAQKKLTNSFLEDRQRARVASNPGHFHSVGDYMKEYSI